VKKKKMTFLLTLSSTTTYFFRLLSLIFFLVFLLSSSHLQLPSSVVAVTTTVDNGEGGVGEEKHGSTHFFGFGGELDTDFAVAAASALRSSSSGSGSEHLFVGTGQTGGQQVQQQPEKLLANSEGTVSPSLADSEGTVSPSLADLEGTVSPSLADSEGTVSPSLADSEGTVSPSLADSEGPVSPLPTDVGGDAGGERDKAALVKAFGQKKKPFSSQRFFHQSVVPKAQRNNIFTQHPMKTTVNGSRADSSKRPPSKQRANTGIFLDDVFGKKFIHSFS
jgi:hypothetical protein